LGFKNIKWIEAIEFVADFAHLGAGQGATTRTTNSTVTARRSDAVIGVVTGIPMEFQFGTN
jgi:cytochrome bd-type quinol oxidase subunit 1